MTTQVRAIAEVATAVTKGDLTRSIQVKARGEVAGLKDNINTMIDNLRVTTERNEEQDWLKTNLAKFTRMLQGQRDLFTVGEMLLSELAPLVNAERGTIYQMISPEGERPSLRRLASYAGGFDLPESIALGEGLVRQRAKETSAFCFPAFHPAICQFNHRWARRHPPRSSSCPCSSKAKPRRLSSSPRSGNLPTPI